MRQLLLGFCFLVLFASTPGYALSVIDFDTAGAGGAPVLLDSQFSGQGILFTDMAIDDFCSGSYCGVIQDVTVGSFDYHSPASFTFSVGGEDAATDFVSILLIDSNIGSGLIEITAFDLEGNSVGASYLTPAAGEQTITLCASGCDITTDEIHRVILSDLLENDGTLVSEISFNDPSVPSPDPVPAPEPGTAALLGLGLSALGYCRRKRS